ncbi:MAG: class II aldolase/adducin family protein [Alphaproteobacteria bacterium]|nr:class II aldolase/adducin family protein [Alphaproteobacteria bacterium]
MHSLAPPLADRRPKTERELRIELAAAYRLIALHGMDDTIYTHITARLPGSAHHFLINPYGMAFDEVTASSLVTIDLEGRKVDDSAWPVNPPGFVIHSAIHAARTDVCCVLHTHTIAGMAVAATETGLLPLSQFALEFHHRLAYHEYEGIATDLAERERLVRDLGDRNAMILRNHGLLTVGRTVAEAFYFMYYLEQSCRVQLAAQSSGDRLRLVGANLAEHTARQLDVPSGKGERLWQAMLRKLDRVDTSYRD